MTENEKIGWMKRALSLAQRAASQDEVPIGALIVLDGAVLGEGYNQRETLQQTLAHAELVALQECCRRSRSWRLPRGALLFVTVEPCLMCTGSMLEARLTEIYFGCSDPKNAGLSLVRSDIEQGRFDHRFETIEGGLAASDCAKLISDYFRNKRLT